jgi:hypothetical protein
MVADLRKLAGTSLRNNGCLSWPADQAGVSKNFITVRVVSQRNQQAEPLTHGCGNRVFEIG